MSKSDILISDFYQKQKDFKYLQSINLHRNFDSDGVNCYNLDVTLCMNPSNNENETLLLNFVEVVEFRSGNFDFGLGCSIFLQITDISDHQMEGINYRVKEDENELIAFSCRTFEFEILKKP